MAIDKTSDTTPEASTAAPADANPVAATTAAPLRNRKGFALAGVIGGGVLVAGLLLGGGVAIGNSLHGGHGGPGGDDRASGQMHDEQSMGGRDGGARNGGPEMGGADNDAQGGPGRPPAGQPGQGQPPVEGGAPAAPGQPGTPATPAPTN